MTYGDALPRIAIMGTRGVPARYGGFETFAEQLSLELRRRGYPITVYGRRGFFAKDAGEAAYEGVKVRLAPTVRHKYLETPLAALFSLLDLARNRADIVILCNAANSPFSWIAKAFGAKLLINVDGIERMRGKWSKLGKLWYAIGERCSTFFADTVIADANVIGEYYRDAYGITPAVVTYGARAVWREPGPTLREFGLESGRYVLYVSRLEPENNALGVIEAYNGLETNVPLVVVGDAPYADAYKAKLKAAAGPNVIFTGFRFGEAYQELQSNCYLYVQATEVGGTHPALIEAMAYGNCVIANGTPENFEVLGGAGVFYPKNDFAALREKLGGLLSNPSEVARFGALARARAKEHYSWTKIADEYEELFDSLLGREPSGEIAAKAPNIR